MLCVFLYSFCAVCSGGAQKQQVSAMEYYAKSRYLPCPTPFSSIKTRSCQFTFLCLVMQHAEPEDYAEVQEGLEPTQVDEVSCSLPACVCVQ